MDDWYDRLVTIERDLYSIKEAITRRQTGSAQPDFEAGLVEAARLAVVGVTGEVDAAEEKRRDDDRLIWACRQPLPDALCACGHPSEFHINTCRIALCDCSTFRPGQAEGE